MDRWVAGGDGFYLGVGEFLAADVFGPARGIFPGYLCSDVFGSTILNVPFFVPDEGGDCLSVAPPAPEFPAQEGLLFAHR
jgi:hypothetical protein